MRRLDILLLSVLGLTWLAGNPARAAVGPGHSLDAIRAEVERFIEARSDPQASDVRVEVGALDRRLRLPDCGDAIAAFLPPGRALKGHVTIGVRCSGERPWTIYVPARVQTYVEVAVLGSPVGRGEPLDQADLRLELRDVSTLRQGYFTRIEEAVGMIARRTLTRGATLSASMLTRPALVRRGERVTLVAGNSALQVRTEGRALRDGVEGQVIAVRNVRSNRVIEGVVVSPGIVEVRL